MLRTKIIGIHGIKGQNKVCFGDSTRWRSDYSTTQLDLAAEASKGAILDANVDMEDIDCVVSASAVYMQPIPCNAVLIKERLGIMNDSPCFDVNTSCTSFVSALELVSYLIESDKYKKVLLVSSDVASKGLNKSQQESYELFSDAAVAVVLTKSNDESKIIASKQCTWAVGAHDTEIKAGGTLKPPTEYREDIKDEYLFDMKGFKILKLSMKVLPEFINNFFIDNNIDRREISLFVPHQASKALKMIMKQLEISNYINIVSDVGNMVSASIPYTLFYGIKEGKIKRGDKIVLLGTGAGLTANIMCMVY